MKINICCTASDDYLKKYKKCYDSHLAYCKKYDVDYTLDNKPLKEGQTRAEWYWRKLSSLLPHFDNYDYVVVLDIDIEIKSSTPNIKTIIDDNSIYYVNGVSNRPNSGFLIIKTDDIGKRFVTEVLNNRSNPVTKEFKAPGENGHVIEYIYYNPQGTKELPIEWNCSQPKHMKDAYILHYTNHLRKYYDSRGT